MRRPEAARNIPNYARDEQYTYLALPDWVIADTTKEYAKFIAKDPPSHFPYFTAISQYWEQYGLKNFGFLRQNSEAPAGE